MMKIQSFGCQPLKPSYQLNSKPAFGHSEADNEIEEIKKTRKEMTELANNTDSKLLSSIGTLGVGATAGALSFVTFKTMAPKGFNVAKSIYNKIADIGIIKTSAKFIKEKTIALGSKIAKMYNNINPESRLGKIKTFITDKINWVKTKTSPITNKIKEAWSWVKTKTTANKGSIKEAAKNTGATLVAVPAAVTAVNADLKKEGDEE